MGREVLKQCSLIDPAWTGDLLLMYMLLNYCSIPMISSTFIVIKVKHGYVKTCE